MWQMIDNKQIMTESDIWNQTLAYDYINIIKISSNIFINISQIPVNRTSQDNYGD